MSLSFGNDTVIERGISTVGLEFGFLVSAYDKTKLMISGGKGMMERGGTSIGPLIVWMILTTSIGN